MENWWQTFFKGGWDALQGDFKEEEATSLETSFLKKLISQYDVERILDVPCGDGRLSLHLACNNREVWGQDFNEKVIDIARRRAKQRGIDINWIVGDMRKLEKKEYFDMLICMWGSFGYFDDEGNDEFIKAVSGTLRKGGLFVLDTHILESLLPKFSDKGFLPVREKIVLEERHYDFHSGRINVEWTIIDDNGKKKINSSIRLYSYSELRTILQNNGFGEFKAFGSYEGEEFQLQKAKRLVLVSEKL